MANAIGDNTTPPFNCTILGKLLPRIFGMIKPATRRSDKLAKNSDSLSNCLLLNSGNSG